MYTYLATPFLIAISAGTAFALPTEHPNGPSGPWISPVFAADFADPGVLEAKGKWYAFATAKRNQKIHIQLAISPDYSTWTLQAHDDALASLPAWISAEGPGVRAPDVHQSRDGSYIMYFAARHATQEGNATSLDKHCIGHATSNQPAGPYIAADAPLFCPAGRVSAADPGWFLDSDNKQYLTYKVDNNDTETSSTTNASRTSPQASTTIMLQELDDCGATLIGEPLELLSGNDSSGRSVGAPSLLRRTDGTYFLFYSSDGTGSKSDAMSFARATSVKGPYTSADTSQRVGTDSTRRPAGWTMGDDAQEVLSPGHSGAARAMFAGDRGSLTRGKFQPR